MRRKQADIYILAGLAGATVAHTICIRRGNGPIVGGSRAIRPNPVDDLRAVNDSCRWPAPKGSKVTAA